MIVLRSQNSYDTNKASDESGLICPEATLTQQHQKDEADINILVKRFGITGELPTGVRVPSYGDFTGVSDYRTAIEAVRAAENSFMEMPADVRNRFDNDPALFVDFCSNPANIEEMIKLGLAVKKEPAEVGGAAVTPPTATPPATSGA